MTSITVTFKETKLVKFGSLFNGDIFHKNNKLYIKTNFNDMENNAFCLTTRTPETINREVEVEWKIS